MEGITLAEVVAAVGGTLVAKADPNRILPTGGCIDSREVQPGDLFFALEGERVDGHQFVAAAFEAGASVAVVNETWYSGQAVGTQFKGPLILTDATDRAMGDLARAYRKRFQIPVVAITGSTGKTTTKDMVAAVLRTRYRVLATEGNLNNHLGVPLTLFRLSKAHQVAVVEMGISKHGELRYLCKIADPTVGIITNIGPTHLEFLGSVEGVAKAKGELLEYLDESSMAILNLDDLWLPKERAKVKGRLLGFGIEKICQFRGERFILDQEGRSHFSLQGHSFHLPIPGRHNVYNALAAIAAGAALDVPLARASEALLAFTPTRLRSQVLERDGIRLINDMYNANPASMRAALDLLVQMAVPRGARRVAVLGDMLELGESTAAAHHSLGASIGAGGVDILFALGDWSQQMVAGAQESGLPADRALAFSVSDSLTEALKVFLEPGDLVLMKGSRGLKMEQIAADLGFEV